MPAAIQEKRDGKTRGNERRQRGNKRPCGRKETVEATLPYRTSYQQVFFRTRAPAGKAGKVIKTKQGKERNSDTKVHKTHEADSKQADNKPKTKQGKAMQDKARHASLEARTHKRTQRLSNPLSPQPLVPNPTNFSCI